MPHIERSIVSLRGRDTAEVAVFEPGAVAFQRDHLGVVDQAVELGEATMSSPNTSPHRPKGLLLATIELARS